MNLTNPKLDKLGKDTHSSIMILGKARARILGETYHIQSRIFIKRQRVKKKIINQEFCI